jgi:hypothetical protein
MAIEQGIWKLAGSAGEVPRKLRPSGLADDRDGQQALTKAAAMH